MKVFSYGGGVQSNAALVLAAQGKLDADVFVFAEVGEDSENPATVRYVRDVAIPYAAEHKIVFESVYFTFGGDRETLFQHIFRPGRKGVPIPARLNGKAPVPRICTTDWKILPINKWILNRDPIGPHTVMLGISLDEMQRMTNRQDDDRIIRTYPLVDMRLHRQDCLNIVKDAGLPEPPKSACWFCPYHSMRAWVELMEQDPLLFSMAEDVERQLTKRVAHNGNFVYLTDAGKPLGPAVHEAARQPSLFGYDSCDSGYCFT